MAALLNKKEEVSSVIIDNIDRYMAKIIGIHIGTIINPGIHK